MRRTWITWLAIAALATGTTGCGLLSRSSQSGGADEGVSGISSSGAGSAGQTASPSPPAGSQLKSAEGNARTASGTKLPKMVVRNKYFQLEVKSVQATYSKASEIADRFGGYVFSSNIGPKDQGFPVPQALSTPSTGAGGAEPGVAPLPSDQYVYPPPITEEGKSGPMAGTIVVKVPAAGLEKAATEMRKLGRVRTEQVSTSDVTEEFVDLSARIRNLKSEEKRYLDFLRAAKNVSDMLRVERELSRIRGEVEQLQSQADYLKKSAAMSTITVYAYESSGLVSASGDDWGIKDAVTQAIRNFVGVVNALIMLCGGFAPFLVLIALGAWLARLLLRRHRRKKESVAGHTQA